MGVFTIQITDWCINKVSESSCHVDVRGKNNSQKCQQQPSIISSTAPSPLSPRLLAPVDLIYRSLKVSLDWIPALVIINSASHKTALWKETGVTCVAHTPATTSACGYVCVCWTGPKVTVWKWIGCLLGSSWRIFFIRSVHSELTFAFSSRVKSFLMPNVYLLLKNIKQACGGSVCRGRRY